MIIDYIEKQMAWSEQTFGQGKRTKGIIQHIQKELKEIEEAPEDLSEWCDVVILALDGAWRAGYSPDEIVSQLINKQAINFRRSWPKPVSQDVAVEHER